ncbi:MAG: DUF417 family protein [Rheinheimera sp.]|nr:DUF417 family protein [Rheinheimera sp.]
MLGSGQGVIKYLALLALGITLWRWPVAKPAERFWLNFVPVGLVLLWIGGMKFFPFEAKGIVDLVSSSPLLSWLYLVADEQMASDLIGLFDWLALLLLAAAVYPWFSDVWVRVCHHADVFNQLSGSLVVARRAQQQRRFYHQRSVVYR